MSHAARVADAAMNLLGDDSALQVFFETPIGVIRVFEGVHPTIGIVPLLVERQVFVGAYREADGRWLCKSRPTGIGQPSANHHADTEAEAIEWIRTQATIVAGLRVLGVVRTAA